MSSRTLLSAALALGLGATACQPPAQECAPLSEGDVAAIRDLERAYIEAALDGDWEAMVGSFTEDGMMMPFDAPIEHGHAVIAAHFEAVDSITEYTLHSSELEGEGGLAYLRQAYTITGYLGGATQAASYTGKSVFILRRQPDGRWRFVIEIWNSDAPLVMPGPGAGT